MIWFGCLLIVDYLNVIIYYYLFLRIDYNLMQWYYGYDDPDLQYKSSSLRICNDYCILLHSEGGLLASISCSFEGDCQSTEAWYGLYCSMPWVYEGENWESIQRFGSSHQGLQMLLNVTTENFFSYHNLFAGNSMMGHGLAVKFSLILESQWHIL